jgi:putative tricarboxylic transport membrane protein
MYIGNLMLLILSIPLVGLFVRILRVRPAILAPITALITILGVYTINNSVFDIFLMIGFGIIGYLMKKAGFDPGPMVLAFVLGSLIESSARRSMLIFGGDPTGFFTRPLSGTILAIFVVVALLPLARHLWRRRSTSVEAAASVAEVDAHRGPGALGVAGDDSGRDVVVLPSDALDVAGVGEGVRVAKSGAGQHDHHRTE